MTTLASSANSFSESNAGSQSGHIGEQSVSVESVEEMNAVEEWMTVSRMPVFLSRW